MGITADANGHEPPPASRWPQRLPMAALALGLLVVSALALPTTIQAGDAGEMATVMLRGGVPHPSGYPWMRLLGLPARALAGLGMNPARAAAWPCALAAVGAWLCLWPLLVRWTGRGPATFAVAVLATASPMMLHANDAEVWGLHLLACALVIRIAAREDVRPWTLGLVFGLAISHHLSAALLLPLVVGAAWPRPLGWARLAKTAGQGLAGGALGLTPLLTLAIGGGGAWRWGDTQSWSGLVHHVLRADYGILSLSLHTTDPAVLDQWTRMVHTVGSAVGAGLPSGTLACTLVLVGVAALAGLRRPAAIRPGVWVGLWLTVGASTLAFPAAHNIDPTRPFGAWILERFDLLTVLLWTPLVAIAAARVRERAPGRIATGVLLVGASLAVATQTARSFARGVPASDTGVERYARDLLRTPPPDTRAVVIGTDDHRLFPVLFVQHVRGDAPKTLYIDASLLSQPWYRAHLHARWPRLPDIEKPVALIDAMWRDPALADTPIFLANVFSRPAASLPVVPHGLLWRVLPPGGRQVTATQVVADHLAAMHRYGPAPVTRSSPSHPWTADLHAAYNEGTGRLLNALRAEGRDADLRALLDGLGSWGPPSR